jgi:HSP20 family molecular chaperone IbpA
MNESANKKESLVYPGIFMPSQKDALVKAGLKHLGKGKSDLPSVNLTETNDLFQVEIAIPNAKREDFFIRGCGNTLSIGMIQKKPALEGEEKFRLQETEYGGFERKITLPENSDTLFTSAEYLSGVLRLHVPKVTRRRKRRHSRIVVY